MTWRDRVDELLFDGESVRERVAVDGHELVVTSHRVLSLAPVHVDGPQFRHVDRPNVADVRLEMHESLRLLGWAILLGAVGFALAFVAASFEFAAAVPDLNGGGPAMGAIDGTIAVLESVLAAFELVLLALGLLTCAAALATFGLYLRDRERRLVVAVAGDEDLSIPLPPEPEAAVRSLSAAIEGEDEPRPIPADGADLTSGGRDEPAARDRGVDRDREAERG